MKDPLLVQHTTDLRTQAVNMARMNFYLWMFIAQEGYYEEALDFLRLREDIPTPFEEWLLPPNVSLTEDVPVYDDAF